MTLPDLSVYKLEFLSNGLSYPLKTVPFNENGLLKLLPEFPEEKAGWPWSLQTNPKIYGSRNMWPKLTIVTPSYNQAQFLEETIRSVLLQNYPNLEFIVIDGGSTDGSRQILEKYSPWISYWQSENDGGQGNAINLGFCLGSGDLNAWLNSDDYYLTDVFHEVADLFIKTNTEFIYGYAYGLNTETRKYDLMKVLPSLDFFLKIPNLIQPSTFWRSRIHQPIWEELHCALDYELWLRLLRGKKRQLIKKPLSVANIHQDAKTYNPKMKEYWAKDHSRMWASDGHGPVPEWKYILFLNRIRIKFHNSLNHIRNFFKN